MARAILLIVALAASMLTGCGGGGGGTQTLTPQLFYPSDPMSGVVRVGLNEVPTITGSARLEIEEIKAVPYAPLSHPFVERLIGTIRRSISIEYFSGTPWTWRESWANSGTSRTGIVG